MIERAVFEELVKEAAANLYDYAALETHPLLFSVIRPPEGYTGSKSEYIRKIFGEAIEYFRPVGKESSLTSPDWRPYLILYKRYIDGQGLQELAATLAISERQLRRDHRRALSALAARLWEQLFPNQETVETEEDADAAFEVQRESLDLRDMLAGLERVLRGRVAEAGVPLQIQLPDSALMVEADRIILRQILISTCSLALHLAGGAVQIHAEESEAMAEIVVLVPPAPDLVKEDFSLEMVSSWAARMGAQVHVELPGANYIIRVRLPLAERRVILVIDDQQPAISMYQRYLSRSQYQVIGITRSEQALAFARSHHPVLILLDVMMPQMDGWELLQTIKLDEDLHDVPVIVCSAWEEPEMARSLGALRFLKKPVTQKDLLDALAAAGLHGST